MILNRSEVKDKWAYYQLPFLFSVILNLCKDKIYTKEIININNLKFGYIRNILFFTGEIGKGLEYWWRLTCTIQLYVVRRSMLQIVTRCDAILTIEFLFFTCPRTNGNYFYICLFRENQICTHYFTTFITLLYIYIIIFYRYNLMRFTVITFYVVGNLCQGNVGTVQRTYIKVSSHRHITHL